MANFCKECGKAIAPGASVCAGCGTPVAPQEPTAEKDGQLGQAVKQQASELGQTVKGKATQAAAQAIQTPLSELSEQFASSETGEAVLGTFGNASDALSQASEILRPLQTVLQSVKGAFGNIVGIIKNKQWKKLMIAGILAGVWLVLMILSACEIDVGILHWLTFDRGGLGRSVFGWVGGLLGKTSVAAMVYTLADGGWKSLEGGFRALAKKENFKTDGLHLLLFGAGSALIIYQFFAGNAIWSDSMSVISGGLLAVVALGSGNGFLYRLAQSLTAKVSGKVRLPQNDKAEKLLTGVTYGFALGTVASLLPFGWTPIILGMVCGIAGVVLLFVCKGKKEVPAV